MKKYGLIGFPVSRSFSKKYFEGNFEKLGLTDHSYSLFELADIRQFPQLLQSEPELLGLNVTIPHKKEIIPFLDELHDKAIQCQSVNVIKIEKGKLSGYNTDYYGFKNSLEPMLQDQMNKAIVLGTGGAAATVCEVLKDLGISSLQIGRTTEISYRDLDAEIISVHPIIINTTPLGMYSEDKPNIPYEGITEKHLLYDLIYNPAETPFLKEGNSRGARIKNGLEMLEIQAELSWEAWNR